MITTKQLVSIFEAKKKIQELQAEYSSDYGRNYSVIEKEMRQAKDKYDSILKEAISDYTIETKEI